MVGAISSAGLDGRRGVACRGGGDRDHGTSRRAATRGRQIVRIVNGSPVDAAGGQLPGVVVVGDGRRRDQLRAQRVQPDQRADRLERHRRLQTAWPAAADSAIRFDRPTTRTESSRPNRRAVPDVSMLADVLPGYAIYCSARAAGLAGPAATRGRRSAARAPRRRCSPGVWRSSISCCASTGREDLGLVNPLLYSIGRRRTPGRRVRRRDSRRQRRRPRLRRSPLGCCAAGPRFDEASGWGSVNIANFSAYALQSVPVAVRVSLSLPRISTRSRAHDLLATSHCSAAVARHREPVTLIGGRRSANRSRSTSHTPWLCRRARDQVLAAVDARAAATARVSGAGRAPSDLRA